MRPTLAVHTILLMLAATNFTAVTFFLGEWNWEFCYFNYAFRNGFGFQYVSELFTCPGADLPGGVWRRSCRL
jgi:hypothetical protein